MGELHAKLVGRSRGSIHIRIGNEHPDSLITYPDVHNLSACAQPIRVRATYPDNATKMGLWVLAVLADGGVAWDGYSQ